MQGSGHSSSEACGAESREDPTPLNDFGLPLQHTPSVSLTPKSLNCASLQPASLKEALNPTPDASDPSKVQNGQRRPRGPTPPKPKKFRGFEGSLKPPGYLQTRWCSKPIQNERWWGCPDGFGVGAFRVKSRGLGVDPRVECFRV